jgi:hypothetical protein
MGFFKRIKRKSAPDEKEILRCSFCNKSQRDVRKLIAGPAVYICNECVGICLDILENERIDEKKGDESPTVLCVLCSRVYPQSDCLTVRNRGPICYVCAGAVQDALETLRKEAESTTPGGTGAV